MFENNQMKFFDLHIKYLRFLLIWPENGQYTYLHLFKSCLMMLPPHLSSFSTLFAVIRQVAWNMDDVEVIIDGTIGLIDFLGCVYMRFCIMSNTKNIQIIFNKIYEFREFCKDEDLIETEDKIRKFTKCTCPFSNVTNFNVNVHFSYSLVLFNGECGESPDSRVQLGELQVNKKSWFNSARPMRRVVPMLLSQWRVTFSWHNLRFHPAILHRSRRHHVRVKYHHAVDRSLDSRDSSIETLQKNVAWNSRSSRHRRKTGARHQIPHKNNRVSFLSSWNFKNDLENSSQVLTSHE